LEYIQYLLDFVKDPLTVLSLFISSHGSLVYAFLFLIVFVETGIVVMPILPGDSLLFSIGLISATTGEINLWVVIPLLILAALLGDNLNYFIGRKFGDYVQTKERLFLLKKSHIDETEKYFAENGGKTIILARFIPIIRTVAPFVAGAGEMPYKTFLSYCVAGAILWVSSITLLGYFLGNIPLIKANFEKVVLLIVFLSILPIILKVLKTKFNNTGG
jgi:membrane-associated protein